MIKLLSILTFWIPLTYYVLDFTVGVGRHVPNLWLLPLGALSGVVCASAERSWHDFENTLTRGKS